MAKTSAMFDRVMTGLDTNQADELRIWARQTGTTLPRDGHERARIYYEKVKGVRVPGHILAMTDHERSVPKAAKTAIALAEEFGIDLRLVPVPQDQTMILKKDIVKLIKDNQKKAQALFEAEDKDED